MERGVSRGKREVCPSDQATRKGLGNLDSLACLGESGGDSPPASLADNDLPSLYGSPGASWQDKPRRGGVRWIFKIHLTYLVRKMRKNMMFRYFFETL